MTHLPKRGPASIPRGVFRQDLSLPCPPPRPGSTVAQPTEIRRVSQPHDRFPQGRDRRRVYLSVLHPLEMAEALDVISNVTQAAALLDPTPSTAGRALWRPPLL